MSDPDYDALCKVTLERDRLRELVRVQRETGGRCGAWAVSADGQTMPCVLEPGHQAADNDPRHLAAIGFGHLWPWTDDDPYDPTPSPWTPELLALYNEVTGE